MAERDRNEQDDRRVEDDERADADVGQMEGFLDMQFARAWGTRLRGALRAAGVIRRKQL